MPKITLNVPDDLLESLRDEHAHTYERHRRKFGPWLCDVWAAWLARAIDENLCHLWHTRMDGTAGC